MGRLERAALLAVLLGAGPAGAQEIAGLSATWCWQPGVGPAAGYEIETSRGGGAFLSAGDTSGLCFTTDGVDGETIVLRVRWFDAGRATFSAWSEQSALARFNAALSAPARSSDAVGARP